MPLHKKGGHVQKFDWIWDRAAFTHISIESQRDYIEVINRVLKPDGTYVVVGSHHDKAEELPRKPPFLLDQSNVDDIMGDHFSRIELLDRSPAGSDAQVRLHPSKIQKASGHPVFKIQH